MVAARPVLLFAALTAALAALPLHLAGCGGDAEAPRHGITLGRAASSSHTLSGALSYEFVPYKKVGDGLDYAATFRRKIRGASVRLVRASDGVEIAKTLSGDDGSYSFHFEGPSVVKLWIYAETEQPQVTVQDNTSGNAVYVLESDQVDAATHPTLDVVATTGWSGSAYTGPRAAAPFAILDAVYGAAQRFMREVSPPPSFPPLRVNWSVKNSPEDGDPAKGAIETSHWDDSQLYILGKESVDTDEFDSHIIVHEWGHYFESKLGRSDSPGGNHTYGDVLDPRVALSEGWGNALSAMILDPDTRYTDASGQRQADGFSFDLEANDTSADAKPGWFSETSVQAILYDVYDGANEPFDRVGFGLPGVYAVMTGGEKESAAMTTAFSFLAALKADHPAESAGIDALVTHNTYSREFGVDAIQDAWGSGETHAGGITGSLPLYVDAAVGSSSTLHLTGGPDFNMLAQNRFVRITGDGAPITVRSTSATDVDLYVYQEGVEVASASTETGNEQLSFATQSGTVYIVNVEGYSNVAGPYSVVVDVAH